MRELASICLSIMTGNARPQAFRNFAARAYNAGWRSADGRGIDPTACCLHDEGVEEWARRITLLLPHLRSYHAEARGWLARHEMTPGADLQMEGRIPFNIFLGGIPL